MRLNRIRQIKGKHYFDCELCKKSKKNAPRWVLLPHPAIINLLENYKTRKVCNMCAMKEEFGSNYRQNKRFQELEDAIN